MKKFILATLLIMSNVASAQDNNYVKGLKAFDALQFKEAVVLLRPFAEQGDCYAEYAVGFALWNDKSDPVNDSVAQVYLTRAAEKKQTHAMGILATMLALKAMSEPDLAPTALMWAELAAMYDPIQASTTTRMMIRSYLEAFQISRAERLIAEKRKIFDRMTPCSIDSALTGK